jgi:acyl transferase domain-containing protein
MRPPVTPWVLSAKSPSALIEQAVRLHHFVEQRPDVDPIDVGYSLTAGGAACEYRAVVVGADRDESLLGLSAIAAGRPAPNVVVGRAAASGATVFVFPGLGSQWTGMAVELLDSSKSFADQMRRCDAAFAEFVDWSLLDVVRGSVGCPGVDRADVVQPLLFAVMASLAAQWRALGIHPDAVVGHSQGELAAAYVAGALSLRDAAMVVTRQCAAIETISGKGGMVSIAEPMQRIHALIEPWDQSISVAAQNGPGANVVTGDAGALDELIKVCERNTVSATRLPVDHALHSADVEALREPLHASLSGVQPRSGGLAFISSVTGAGLDTTILDGAYWFANLRQPVLFEQSVRWAYEHGYRTFVEVGPHPVLSDGIRDSLRDYGDAYTVAGTLRCNEGGLRRFLLSAAEVYVRGKSPNWPRLFAAGARRIDLPIE